MPLVISAPHGGEESIEEVPPRLKGTSEQDFHTIELTNYINGEMQQYSLLKNEKQGR